MTLLDSSANPGSIISNNGNKNNDGGAVQISGGTFNLYNATVQYNQTEAENSQDTVRGGAITLKTADSTFNMFSGKVVGSQLIDFTTPTIDKGCGGTIYSIGHVMHAQGKHIRIESSPEIPLEVDGELLGATPIEFNVLHREVKVIVNRSFLDKLKK
jgi:hypothetical protein